jgi:glycosyltransferase involved in cell wall biosynthesis
LSALRVALVHDWLTGMRGGERVLEELALWFPDAELFTLVFVPGATSPAIERLPIHASPLSRLPGAARHYRKLLPLFPWAIRRFELRGFDLVISTSHAVAKGARIAVGTPHLCYCFTPMRYVWDQADAYLGRGALRSVSAPLIRYLRNFDVATSGPAQVQRFVACSQNVAGRIARCYGREAGVVYPPIALDRLSPSGKAPGAAYLMVAGFVPYKQERIAIEAFRGSTRRLRVAGDGPLRRALAASAPPNVEFLGRVSDAVLAELYAECRALVFPSDEDFGLVPLEAQACGRPVVALGRGGARETVIDHGGAQPATGIWFHEASAASLRAALDRFESLEPDFDPDAIRAHAEQFSRERFRERMAREIALVRQGVLGSSASASTPSIVSTSLT